MDNAHGQAGEYISKPDVAATTEPRMVSFTQHGIPGGNFEGNDKRIERPDDAVPIRIKECDVRLEGRVFQPCRVVPDSWGGRGSIWGYCHALSLTGSYRLDVSISRAEF